MMNFSVSIENMINIIIIAAGIGVCGMNILQVRSGSHLRKQVTRYFQLFFGMIILYIGCHLARQLMEGFPGEGIGFSIRAVTFLEFLASGVMAFLFSELTLYIANPAKGLGVFQKLFRITLAFHVILMVVSQFSGLCYYFDASNVYHRAPAYLLSNLAHIVMLVADVYLLTRNRESFSSQIRRAFWLYIVAPIAAIAIQAFFHDIQFIILATVFSAVYVARVIMMDEMQKYEEHQQTASRLGTELEMATAIQSSQLPKLFPAFPHRAEFDIYASMTPAKEVGGDFYDFFMVDDDHIALVMADVSGKGVPAALFMMVSRVLIKSHLQNGETPGEALANVNDQLCEGNDMDMFVTVWAAVLEISTGKGIAANAGHEHPALRHANQPYELVVYRHSPPVATIEGIPFREHEFELHKGDSLFVYTDGVAEATDANDELFGEDRMLEALNTNPEAEPKEAIGNVLDGINRFVHDAEQFDDITMLCLEYKGV